ncbi:uncharacterized protein LOC131614996 [Vicia villosa]|uniref:uncharacterized protein LOC131614996 n=1 Tax=Vicia villosa TaxID=3911 RepID=UPI00273B16C3|nr:uncharacterized protein LOC131614996 [Vicia villosa]
MAGRVVLINAVLNAIPIYSLSFYKAPAKWRILTEKEAVWSGILKNRYGNPTLKVLVGDISVVNKKDSIWWRDLLTSDNYANMGENHFAGAVTCNVGDGNVVPYWYACWAGTQTLREAFPKLFAVASDHLIYVAATGSVTATDWEYNSASLFSAETVASNFLVQQQLGFLQHISVEQDVNDEFCWALTADGAFSVKSCFDRFKEKLSSPPLDAATVLAINHLWKFKVPSKLLCFGWRVILDRIATKDQLFKRGITAAMNDLLCVFCEEEVESLSHLLCHCGIVSGIWRKVYNWLGSLEEITLEEFEEFFKHCDKVKWLNRRHTAAVI